MENFDLRTYKFQIVEEQKKNVLIAIRWIQQESNRLFFFSGDMYVQKQLSIWKSTLRYQHARHYVQTLMPLNYLTLN